MTRSHIALLVACALALAACARHAGHPNPSTPPGAIVSELDGVFLIVDAPQQPLGAGERPTFVAELRNDRSQDVDFSPGGCAFADLRVQVPVPWEPTGRTWEGRAKWLKDYLLQHAYGPGGVAAFSPIDSTLLSTPCDEAGPDMLRPGETLTADFTRAVGNFLTTYSYATPIVFSITVDLDLQNTPPPRPTGNGIPQHFFPEYRHLSANGALSLEGRPATVLSAGQAIDALLDDGRVVDWLEHQDLASCRTANLFLDNDTSVDAADGALQLDQPAVWFIQLYCEVDGPDPVRHFAAARVDAATGEIRRLEVCDVDCG